MIESRNGKMGKILIIAEKPSVGRDIARVLGCHQKGDGCLIGEQYVVTWAIGHLATLAPPEVYDPKYKLWTYETLPIIPPTMKLIPISRTKKQLQIIKKWMKDPEIQSLICATDSGREGELIFRYIYEIAKCKKPFQRLWISSMTDTAIKEGFSKLKPGTEYDLLFASAKCRAEADWLVGMNGSRAFTIRYNTLLSVGRVQTPTLALLVHRQKNIDDFVPEDYWEVYGIFPEYQGIWFKKEPKNTRIETQEQANEIANKIQGKEGQVIKIQEENKKQLPPLLYDLTELQREGNRRFGYSAQKVLSIAQTLYEKKKMITYPRTDSRYLSQDMIPMIHQILKQIQKGPYQKEVEKVLLLPKLPITKRIINDAKITDHHAIIPTEVFPKWDSLTKEERNMYELIVLRFIAVFYPDYLYKITQVVIEVEKETLLVEGKEILQWGWMSLYPPKKQEDQMLPAVKKGDRVKVFESKVEKKQTQPPKPYTEATLLSAMENAGRFVEDEELKEQMKENGLGTPATRAATIERLIQVGYLERKGKSLFPTEKGIQLIEIVPPELKSPEMTGKWEKALFSIAKGSMHPDRFMGSIIRYVQYIVEEGKKQNPMVVFTPRKQGTGKKTKNKSKKITKGLGNCPLCKQGIVFENSKAFYCSQWKQGCSLTIWKNSLDSYGCSVTTAILQKLLKDQTMDNMDMILPQTQEPCTATLYITEKGLLEFKNVKRKNKNQ